MVEVMCTKFSHILYQFLKFPATLDSFHPMLTVSGEFKRSGGRGGQEVVHKMKGECIGIQVSKLANLTV